MEKAVLTIEHLHKVFSDDGTCILDDINLTVNEREFLCILGPSGCGKTTFLRCVGGFTDYEGTIKVEEEVKKEPDIDRMMVFQDFNQLFPWLTVLENIAYPLKMSGKFSAEEIELKAKEALGKVLLSDYADYYPAKLSGGMKQRVAIAKALALKSKIILMDEPFAALDAMTRRELQQVLREISLKEECTFIFITHNIQEAVILGSRIMVLGKKGHIIVDQVNDIEKPVTPASEGYGALWQKLYDALYIDK